MRHRLGGLLLLAVCTVGCGKPPAAAPTAAAPPPASEPPPNLTLANFELIREGMTLAEVEDILGPTDETTGADVRRPDGRVVKDVQSATWVWRRATVLPDGKREEQTRRIVVHFKDGKVTSKEQVGLE